MIDLYYMYYHTTYWCNHMYYRRFIIINLTRKLLLIAAESTFYIDSDILLMLGFLLKKYCACKSCRNDEMNKLNVFAFNIIQNIALIFCRA